VTDDRITPTGAFATEYASCRTKEKRWMFDVKLASRLKDLFSKSKVADLGCGVGHYVEFFNDNEVPCKGYDGIPEVHKLSNGLVSYLDLSIPIKIPKFDWILCLEVGEHIPKQYESIFIENLKRSFKKGIVLSWAIPGQYEGSVGHVNNRSNDYVIDKLSNDSIKYNKDIAEDLRKHTKFDYLKNTIMVFKKRTLTKFI
jgi:cyclopropane fatty-acyl-phospholipid synthase-like methyltransferase